MLVGPLSSRKVGFSETTPAYCCQTLKIAGKGLHLVTTESPKNDVHVARC